MKSSADSAAAHTGEPADGSEENLDETVDDDSGDDAADGTAEDEATESEEAAEDSAENDDESDPEATTSVEEATESEEASSQDTSRRWWRRRGQAPDTRRGTPLLRWVAAVVLIAVLSGAGYEGWVLYQHHQKQVAAEQALEAAKNFTLALTSVDPNAIDKNFSDVLDGATGEFKDMYTQASEQLRQVLIENKAAAHGTVIDAAVKSATRSKVEVVLFVDQSVSNASVQGPQLDRSRIVITMEKVNGRWLASKLEMP